jgi:Arc/MetJ-type ribon-helix-helix transcriptional regulator
VQRCGAALRRFTAARDLLQDIDESVARARRFRANQSYVMRDALREALDDRRTAWRPQRADQLLGRRL